MYVYDRCTSYVKIYSTVSNTTVFKYCKCDVDFQKQLKIRAPRPRKIPDIIKSLRWGARELLIF